MKPILYILAMALPFSSALAQTPLELKQHLIDGVELFNSEEHESAAISFTSGISLENFEDIAAYNKGRALLETEDLEGAASAFQKAIEHSDNPALKSLAWYNSGNLALVDGDPETAIEAYKSALRHNPNFSEARHNLANAYKLLQQQEQQEQQEEQDGEEENEEEKDGDQDKKEGENEKEDDQEEKDSEQEEKDGENDQPSEKQLSKEEMARILENLENEEEKIQARLMKAKGGGKKRIIENEW